MEHRGKSLTDSSESCDDDDDARIASSKSGLHSKWYNTLPSNSLPKGQLKDDDDNNGGHDSLGYEWPTMSKKCKVEVRDNSPRKSEQANFALPGSHVVKFAITESGRNASKIDTRKEVPFQNQWLRTSPSNSLLVKREHSDDDDDDSEQNSVYSGWSVPTKKMKVEAQERIPGNDSETDLILPGSNNCTKNIRSKLASRKENGSDRTEQSITELIAISKQRVRLGLGLHQAGLKSSSGQSDSSEEEIQSRALPVTSQKLTGRKRESPCNKWETSMSGSLTMRRDSSQDDTEDSGHETDSVGWQLPSKTGKGDIRDNNCKANEKSSLTLPSSNVARNIMLKMGFKEGGGLGKNEQGITGIVEISKQRGRRGLGLHLKGLEPSDVQWDANEEEVNVDEVVRWMPQCTEVPPHMQEMRRWMKEGPKKKTIDDEVEFCSPEIMGDVLACKSVFDSLEPEEMRRARTRSNPFETVRGVIFQNRAAMKMANIDTVFDNMFTNPKDEDGNSMVGQHELLYFADVCAGPGGFSEYILWKKGWDAKGFGFTLKGPNDFKLEEFFAGPPETFEPHYGIDDTGDIYVPENLREFYRFVMEQTGGTGLHFVMADGGFSVDGQENIQEVLSKRLYLCQFLCALSILRTGGHFVCKLFDIFTPFSVGLVYLMYRAFNQVCIHKPNTSRPANSERYIVCKWKQENTKDIHDYMFEVNCRLGQLSLSDTDVVEIVPLDTLKDDFGFYNYIVESNNKLGQCQIVHLRKIRAFAQNTELYEERQSEIRKQCLAAWQVPDKVRSAPSRPDPASKFRELIKGDDSSFMQEKPAELTKSLLRQMKSILDYRCFVSGVEKVKLADQCFLLGLGRTHVFRWDGASPMKWTKLDTMMELPMDTLIYVELVYELKGEGRAQRKVMAVHIVDAMVLGGRDVRHMHFTERIALAQKFAKAISKPSRPNYTPVRVKQIFRFEEVRKVFDRLAMKMAKGAGGVKRLCYQMEDERHYLPTGLFLIRTVENPWMMHYSKSANRKYYFNTHTGKSTYECPKVAIASFRSCFSSRLFWAWEDGVKLMDNHSCAEGKLHREDILHVVQTKAPNVLPD